VQNFRALPSPNKAQGSPFFNLIVAVVGFLNMAYATAAPSASYIFTM